MPTALEALANCEANAIAQDGLDGFFNGQFEAVWMGGDRRARLQSVLFRLNDLNVVNVQMWANYETAVTFAGNGKALWLSYNGHAFHIWTNFGGEESTFDMSNNIILEDEGDVDNRQTVIQIVRDYFRQELVEAA